MKEDTRYESFHGIGTVPEGGPRICAGLAQTDKLKIEFRFAQTTRNDPICKPNQLTSTTLPINFKIKEHLLVRAAEWILKLDASALEAFNAGDIVAKSIPAEDPAALATPTGGPETFWRYRMSVGSLVRPLFLKEPSLERLFPYQRSGVDWLLNHGSGILADDMGLGKTAQAITATRLLLGQAAVLSVLVICPRSLLATWEEEFSRWAPEVSRLRVVPQGTHRESVWSAVVSRVHVLLTNYEQTRELPTALLDSPPDLIIADEAHRIRNMSAQITKGVRKLRSSRIWGLTGTPIERDTEDLATLLSILEPSRFSVRDARLTAGELRTRARPYLLRRLKKDVLEELPKVIDSKEPLELLPHQRASYDQILRAAFTSKEEGHLFRIINELRTVCDFDPRTEKSCKIERIIEISQNIVDSGEKAVVFSYLLRPLHILATRLQTEKIGCVILEGSMTVEERDSAITRFRSDDTISLLLASSKIGGEGLTLTEANHVIFFNEWWNPSANAQARDRVVRIGQRRGVVVYRFRCRGTIEETLERILAEKEDTFADLIDRMAEGGKAIDRDVAEAVRTVAKVLEEEQGS